MQANIAAGDHVRVRPSGETGRITRVVQASDGRPTYEVEFDQPSGTSGASGESGGLYVAEDIELVA